MNDYFSTTWAQARAAFCAALAAHPTQHNSGSLEIQPGYTLDYGWTGPANASRVLVYSSGLHGIEGFSGGAVQCALLHDDAKRTDSAAHREQTATLWLHSLNPWGMAHGRRANEQNVDLNRNFFPKNQPFSADDDDYAKLETLLNPRRLGVLDAFYLKTGYQILRRGLPTLRNAVARGQYSFPRGIFFGGQARQATTICVLDTIVPWLRERQQVVWIDLHSGRGARGEVVAFVDGHGGDTAALKQAFGHMLHAWEPNSELGYEMRGGMLSAIVGQLAPIHVDALTVEFGTVGDVSILKAMRAENWLFHHGPADQSGGKSAADHPLLRAMHTVFNPADSAWQRGVIAHGRDVDLRARTLFPAVGSGL